MEANPGEAIKNNVFGTKTVADAALAAGVQAFVLVSTDKAVNPSSVMGATKRVAELYVQTLNTGGRAVGRWGSGEGNPHPHCPPHRPTTPPPYTPTRFLAVRFGNVLGSSGSVVPIFQKQIEAGGPVTVTHPDMRRYFMTIPEASQLVMQAGAIGKGGEVFVLDMGQPVRILDLARELIVRNGLKPDEDIDVRVTGVRPGEKLYEELSCDDEQTRPTAHEKIRVWQLPPAGPQHVARALDLLAAAAEGPPAEAVAALAQCVPEYRPAGRRDTATEAPVLPTPVLRLVPGRRAGRRRGGVNPTGPPSSRAGTARLRPSSPPLIPATRRRRAVPALQVRAAPRQCKRYPPVPIASPAASRCRIVHLEHLTRRSRIGPRRRDAVPGAGNDASNRPPSHKSKVLVRGSPIGREVRRCGPRYGRHAKGVKSV